jgi:hypothetical protein
MGDETQTGRIDVGPIHLTLTEWGIRWFTVLVLVGASVWGAIWVWDHLEPDKVRVSREFLVQQEEMQRHFGEGAADEVTFQESVHLRLYESDGCISATRSGPGGILATRFMVAPGRVAPPPVSIGAEMVEHEVQLAGAPSKKKKCPPDTGHCADPHAGEFDWWHGDRKDCWVQVWRQWSDCCRHYQWYNECYGYWDEAINWTYCVH